jgi:hypothetical protein
MNNNNNDNPIDLIQRRDIFRDGNIRLIDLHNITTFTEDDIIAALDNYQLDFLETLLLRHPDMLNNITIGNDVYGYVLTPPTNVTADTIVRMYAFLMNRLEIPPPPNIGSLLFHHWVQLTPGDERIGDWRRGILQILRLTRSAGYSITPTNLYNLTELYFGVSESVLPENELSPYILEEILTDDEFRRCIRDYIQSRPPNVPYGHLVHERQSEEYGGDVTGPLYDLLWTLIHNRPDARLLAVVLPELTSRDLIPLFDFFRERLDDDHTADPATYALLINHYPRPPGLYPRPPVVSGPLFPEEENTYWLGLKSRADAFAVAADRDVAERLAINDRSAVNEAARARARAIAPASSSTAIRTASARNRPGPSPLNPPWNVTSRARPGPSSYTDEQNRARARAITPASSSTAIRPASARNRPGPSPLIPLRNVTSRARPGPSSYTDEQNRARERAIASASSSTAIRPASTRNRLGPSPLIPLRNVTAREMDSGLEMCAICLQNMGSSILMQPAGTHFVCGHTFCVDCSQAVRLRTCPLCREPSVIDPLPRNPHADFLFSHC